MGKRFFLICVLLVWIGVSPPFVTDIVGMNAATGLYPLTGVSNRMDTREDKTLTCESLLRQKQLVSSDQQYDSQIFSNLGSVYYENGEYGKAIETFVNSVLSRDISYFFVKENARKITWKLVEAGNSCFKIGDFYLADFFYAIALGSFRNDDDMQGTLTALNNIGLCRLGSGQLEEAMLVFRISDKVALKNKLSQYHFLATIYVSKVQVAQGHSEQAIHSLKILEKELTSLLASSEMKLMIQASLVDLYIQSGEIDKAVLICNKILEDQSTSKRNHYVTSVLLTLAQYYAEHQETNKALSLALEVELNLKGNPNLDLKANVCSLLCHLHKTKGDFKRALSYIEECQRLRSINDNDSIRKLIWGFEKKIDQQSLIFEKIRAEHDAFEAHYRQKNQKKFSLFLLAITVLLVILVVFMKGFDSRVDILLESIESYRFSQKILFYLVLSIYFALFFYFLLPVAELNSGEPCSSVQKIFAGLHVLALTMAISYGGLHLYRKRFAKKISKYHFYQLLSIIAFMSVVVSLLLFSFPLREISFNMLISLSLIVFASFMMPFFGIIIYVETIILKKYQAMSEIANFELMEIRQNLRPIDNIVEIQSEKTSAKLQFNINDLIAAEAQGNYCMFYFRSGDLIQRRIIHISLKLLENQLARYRQIMRCHKSFIINIHRVVEVKGNSRGYILHFHPDIEPMPISRSYQKKVMDLIRRERDSLIRKTDD